MLEYFYKIFDISEELKNLKLVTNGMKYTIFRDFEFQIKFKITKFSRI